MSSDNKLSIKVKLGYSMGQLTDSIGYNIFYAYFLFFLTDYAKIPPAIAGTILTIGLLWDALTDPIVGSYSDNIKTKNGRRRPLMIRALIPYAFSLFLLFNDFSGSVNIKVIYFIVISIIYWTSYKFFVIPFFALGAELTDDFDERTSVRSWAGIFLYIAVLIGSAVPPLLLKFAGTINLDSTSAWRMIGSIYGCLIAITGVLCWALTKGKEHDFGDDADEASGTLLQNFKDILKIKQVRFLGVSIFCWSALTAVLSSAPVYLMINILKFEESKIALFFTLLCVFSIICIPLVNFLSSKYDKKRAFTFGMLISSLGIGAFYIFGFPNFTSLVVFLAFTALGGSTFWTLSYSMMYDISELDEFLNGTRREGTISAMMSLFQKLGNALIIFIMGTLLQMSGYDGSLVEQIDSAKQMVLNLNTVIPAIIGLIAVGASFYYRIDKKIYNSIKKAIELKKAGKDYSKEFENFKDII